MGILSLALTPMQPRLELGLLICIGGFLATTSSTSVLSEENERPDDEMFIATLAEKFQAFGNGIGPITCPQFQYPILVPPANSYLMVSESNNNAPISQKKKRYSPFFFIRSPTPEIESPFTYRYQETEGEANFINTDGRDMSQLVEPGGPEPGSGTREKRYSPFPSPYLHVWKHPLGRSEEKAGSLNSDRGLTPGLPISGAPGKVSKRYTPFGSPPFINYWKNKQKETREITNSKEKQELYQRILLQMLDEMNQKDKKYMPFLNAHRQDEWQTENLEKSSVENQEKVLERILEVLRKLQEWREQKDRQLRIREWQEQNGHGLSGADVGISKVSKRYSPFNHWQDGQLGNLENQEQVHQRILEVLRRIREWKEQKDRQISSGADEGISRVSKRYSPFNHWQDGQARNLENQEQVHDRILEVLRRLREWKEQKDRQVSSGADEGISRVSKRYAPFA